VLHVVAFATALCYPFAIYFGLQYMSAITLGALLAAVILVRVLLGNLSKELKLLALLVIITLLVLHRWMQDDEQLLKFYPVAVNFVMLLVFSVSLLQDQPLIERIARARGEDVGDHNMGYLRVLTAIWTVFFVFNGAVACWTALYATMDVWLFYNGFVSYLLIGGMVGGELIFRHYYIRHLARRAQ